VVVVDDHSADGTLAIARRHAAEDPRVTVVEAQTRGGGSARNAGALLATTEFLAFADGDDLVPPGAYGALTSSLAASGSQLVVGNFYKFSALRAWRPSLRWKAFEEPRRGIRLADHPRLIWNRACWNRVFRTDFWRSAGIAFPDVARSNDIVPMTRALVAADRIDVVPDVVYLYRERPGGGSMTAAAGSAVGLLSYLSQEVECADLLEGQPDGVRAQYQRVVFDADGWVHVRRALVEARAEGEDAPSSLVADLRRLFAVTDEKFRAAMPADRRLVVELLCNGRIAEATDCLERLGTGWDPAHVLDDTAFWIRMVELATPADNQARGATLAELVVRPLATAAGLASDDDLSSVIDTIGGERLALIDRSLGDETRRSVRRALRALRERDIDALRRQSSVAYRDAFLLRAARFRRGRIHLDGVAEISVDGDEFPVTARRMATRGEVAAGTLRVATRADGARVWTLVLRAARIVDGNWQLVVRLGGDDLGALEIHITAGQRGPVVPEARWARLVVLPRQQAGDRVTLAARGSVLTRAARRLGALVRRD
jgi:glycosyltransferase involved in cell wall biosynthesis